MSKGNRWLERCSKFLPGGQSISNSWKNSSSASKAVGNASSPVNIHGPCSQFPKVMPSELPVDLARCRPSCLDATRECRQLLTIHIKGPLGPLIICTVEVPHPDEVTTPRSPSHRVDEAPTLRPLGGGHTNTKPVTIIDLGCSESNRVQTGVGWGQRGTYLPAVVSLLQLQLQGRISWHHPNHPNPPWQVTHPLSRTCLRNNFFYLTSQQIQSLALSLTMQSVRAVPIRY